MDFSVPIDTNVRAKEEEKQTKYANLARQIRKQYSVSTRIIPVVVGCLGVVSDRLEGYLKELAIPDILGGIQTSAIIGTANILKKTLTL